MGNTPLPNPTAHRLLYYLEAPEDLDNIRQLVLVLVKHCTKATTFDFFNSSLPLCTFCSCFCMNQIKDMLKTPTRPCTFKMGLMLLNAGDEVFQSQCRRAQNNYVFFSLSTNTTKCLQKWISSSFTFLYNMLKEVERLQITNQIHVGCRFSLFSHSMI